MAKNDCFGVGIYADDLWFRTVRNAAMDRSYTHPVNRTDILREALDRAITPDEWQKAQETIAAEAEKEETRLRHVKVRGDQDYHALVLMVAKLRGLSLGELVVDAVKRSHYKKGIEG